MGRAARREQLSGALESRAQSIQETFQIFEGSASSSVEKIEWSRVINMGDEVSKQATIGHIWKAAGHRSEYSGRAAGMLWSGETPNVRELEENIDVFCNVLQGFLLLCHGSTVGAGCTLLGFIHASAKQVVERSLALLREAVSSYGIPVKKNSIPQLSGAVWEACTALKRTPTSNYVAIGRSITQVAISIKDVLREMKELKPEENDDRKEFNYTKETCEEDTVIDDELGNDLSPEEMNNAKLVISVVSDTLGTIKELIHFITSLLKRPSSERNIEKEVDSMERLLKCCQEIGGQIDELGACVYPPQEVQDMKALSAKMMVCADQMWMLVVGMTDSSAEILNGHLDQWKKSLDDLKYKISSSDDNVLVDDLETTVEKLDLSM